MNCEGIKKMLAEGRPLTKSAMHHLENCEGCSAMLQALVPSGAEPERARLQRIQEVLGAPLKSVRPLASDRVLTWQFFAMFVAFSMLVALPFGYNGFHALNGYQRFAYFAVISIDAGWLALTVVREMIPGSKRKASAWWAIVAALASLALLAALLFHNFDLDQFVTRGVPCLRLGSLCAILSGGLFWFIFRKGFFTSPVGAGASIGVFAGLTGVAVLALHCPIENAAHIIVWHLGAMVLGGSVGALAGGVGVEWLHRKLIFKRPS